MKGWKTYAGAGIIVVCVALELIGKREIAEAVMALGVALGIVGIRHKLGRMAVQNEVRERTGGVKRGKSARDGKL